MKELTKVPSELIKLAITDMKKAINDNLEINMYSWIETKPDNGEICAVCMAGAIMLYTNNITTKPEIISNDINHNQYHFLNNLRQGYLEKAFEYLKINSTETFKNHFKYKRQYCHELNYAIYNTIDEWFKELKKFVKYLKTKSL